MKQILILILTIGTAVSIAAKIRAGEIVRIERPAEAQVQQAENVIQIAPTATPAFIPTFPTTSGDFTGRMCTGATCPTGKPPLVFPPTHTPTPQ